MSAENEVNQGRARGRPFETRRRSHEGNEVRPLAEQRGRQQVCPPAEARSREAERLQARLRRPEAAGARRAESLERPLRASRRLEMPTRFKDWAELNRYYTEAVARLEQS